MSVNDIEDLLDRYQQGTARPEEIERVEAWLNQHGSKNSAWQQMDQARRHQWLESLFTDIDASINGNETPVTAMPARRNLWRGIAAAAAVLAIFLTIYVEWPALHGKAQQVQLTVLNVGANQKKHVVLADGSKIWINAGSELKYPAAFTGKTREVYLSGEAYFDIQHDALKPFIIHTGKVITTVLGTAFNIKEDSREHTIVVTVTRGKVSVANGTEALGTITPNQQISFNNVSNQHFRRDINAKQVIAWQQGEMHFNDITFADAAAQLQNRFKVKITFGNDKIKNCRFTGTALQGENLDKILKVVCAFNKASYQTGANGNIIITGTGCN